jgi:DnaJ like chaperone protein
MSVWGKLIGGAAGLALGGPVGAILGLAAGHGVDSVSREKKSNKTFNATEKEQVFASGVISLAAKLSKADGVITKEEIITFKRIFDFPKEDEREISKLFNAAKESKESYKDIANQIYKFFQKDKGLLFELLNSLFAIAYADNELHKNEKIMLEQIAKIFKFSTDEFEHINSLFIKKTNNINNLDVYLKVLGVKKDTSMEVITKKYKVLIKEYHPDRLQGLGLPKEFIQLANKKLASINEAYSAVKNEKTNK